MPRSNLQEAWCQTCNFRRVRGFRRALRSSRRPKDRSHARSPLWFPPWRRLPPCKGQTQAKGERRVGCRRALLLSILRDRASSRNRRGSPRALPARFPRVPHFRAFDKLRRGFPATPRAPCGGRRQRAGSYRAPTGRQKIECVSWNRLLLRVFVLS